MKLSANLLHRKIRLLIMLLDILLGLLDHLTGRGIPAAVKSLIHPARYLEKPERKFSFCASALKQARNSLIRIKNLAQIQIILLHQTCDTAHQRKHIDLILAGMGPYVIHAPCKGFYLRPDCFRRAKLDTGFQLRFILLVQLQFSSAYRLHIADVDGSPRSHNRLVSQRIHCRLIGF